MSERKREDGFKWGWFETAAVSRRKKTLEEEKEEEEEEEAKSRIKGGTLVQKESVCFVCLDRKEVRAGGKIIIIIKMAKSFAKMRFLDVNAIAVNIIIIWISDSEGT